ncbi:hypothetical protein K469DRAFT_661251 [Zopfia rhizophila CBS 207.26]|uniref:Uncharacterized protein n=1 Tax=Zopfia rhizophila CBS 207.26 TaxID=1314779 RepID=A0A6A6E7U9_9PEZI|nr:hypothetical protein K469DRAFT_661251 [Zopfia rhizophila CBS 207.26]
MFFQAALLGGLLVAGQASAKVNSLFQRTEDLEDRLLRDADSMVATLTRRQDPNAAAPAPQISITPQSGDAAKADLAKWETQTQEACQNALMSLNGQASNPSGIAVCYNLPFLDNQTGVFQAELRMYNVSAPINPWVGITAADISMTLSYRGATVQSMNGTFMKRDEITWPPLRAREVDGLLVERQNSGSSPAPPTELKVLNYVGKINSNLMGTAMTQATLQPLLVPEIQLAATSPSGEQVTMTLSSQEASFVNGVFAQQATTTNDPSAKASASAAAAKAAPFVLPGTTLAFFPTGLVITCVWTAGFFAAVGLGTVGRIQFREQYRRRMKREMANGMRTI